MKKWVWIFLISLLMFSLPASVAASEVVVIVDGEDVDFTHPPLMENGRTLIPMREMFDAMGVAVVSWDDTTRTASAVVGELEISIPIGSELPTVDDVPILIEAPAMFMDNRMYIPLRFAAESLGNAVSWEADSETAIITTVASTETVAADNRKWINNFVYTEEGVASWYGARFHGNNTYFGETFDMNLHTAAHPTLPLNTIAKVTYEETGRSVWVRINDRGPCQVRHPDRIIDISHPAAQTIGMKWIGAVKVEILGER